MKIKLTLLFLFTCFFVKAQTWQPLGPNDFDQVSYGTADYTSIAFNGTTPYVVYTDAENGFKATVMKLNAGGTAWEAVGTAGFSARTAEYTSIISNGSELIVAYSSGGAFAKRFPLGTLPVKLTNYTATVKFDKQVNLTWQTASEKSNNFFTISKSRDGQTFEKLVNVNSKGDNGATYSTIDFSPFAGTSYYKLSQTDADGKKEELGIKTIKLADLKEQGLSVYPNPVVNGIVNIRSTESNGLQNVLVYDLNGKEVYKEQLTFTNGTATYKLNKHMIKGTYILRIEGVERSVKIVVE